MIYLSLEVGRARKRRLIFIAAALCSHGESTDIVQQSAEMARDHVNTGHDSLFIGVTDSS